MTTKFIAGLSEIVGDYDLFLLDLWGVVHNGMTLYPKVADCLHELLHMNKRVVLLSNAPRPGHAVSEEILKYGVMPDLYSEIITSGDLTQAALRRRDDNWHARLGRYYFHLGPARSKSLLEGIDGEAVAIDEAEYLLVSGVFDDETEQAEDYRGFLQECVARDLPLVCANPDKIVMKGENIIPCAGAVADLYEELGGEVARHGKPYPDAYETALRHADGIALDRSIMVGDTFHTDIAGGRGVGMSTLWIAGGVHMEEVRNNDGQMDLKKAREVIANSGEWPTFASFSLAW